MGYTTKQSREPSPRHRASGKEQASPTEAALDASIKIGRLLRPTAALEPLLHQLAQLIQAHYQYEGVSIYLIDGDQTLELHAHAGKLPHPLAGKRSRFPVDQSGPLGQAMRERRGLVCEAETSAHEPRQPQTWEEIGWRVVLPLEPTDQVIGVIDIRTHRLEDIGAGNLSALSILAGHAAIAIQNAQHYEGEKRQRRLIEKLNAVGQTLAQTLDPEKVLDMILIQLATIVPHDRGAIMLEDGNELIMRTTRGFPVQASPLRIRVPIREEDVYQTIRSSREPLLIPDVSRRTDWQYVKGLPPARSWLGVPLILENSVIGMLSLTREHSDTYSSEEITLSATFANQASLALNNARLYDDLTQMNTTLEQTVAELRQRTHDLQVTYQQLKRLDQAKSDFIAVASHELRTPLTVLSGYSQMLANDPVISGNEYRGQIIGGLLAGAERLNTIVDDMLDMARIDNQALEIRPEPLFPAVLIKAIRPTLKQILRDREITLSLDKSLDRLPLIEADTTGIRKVIHHLMVNAVKYTPDGGSVRIWGRTVDARQTTIGKTAVEIVISDTGIGIDPVVQELIFAKFYQTGQISIHSSGVTKFKGGGPGLGLAIARGIVEAHGGRIWVESPGYDEEHCPGSDFHVLLPLQPDAALAEDE